MSLVVGADASGAVRALVAERLGLHAFPDDRWQEVLAERMRANRCADVATYGRLLMEADASGEEWRALAGPLTVGETYFFRAPDQFRALAEVALPRRLAARKGHAPVRCLSAGCASGEEAYSIALAATEGGGPPWPVAVEGIDLHGALVARARLGRYSPWSLRATSASRVARHFERDGAHYRLRPEIRELVRFEEGNLLDAATRWAPGSLDIVFFRNVSIYFTAEATRRVIAGIARALAPGGYLFLGPAETLRGVSTDFHLRHTHDTFYYERKGPDAPASGAEAPAPRLPLVPGRMPVRRPVVVAPVSRRPAPEGPGVLERTRALFQEERFADALALLDAAGPDAGDRPEVAVLRGALLVQLGRTAEAEAACRVALAADPGCADAHYLLALGREAAGDLAAADRHLALASRLDPLFALPHLHAGLRAGRAGDRAAASAALQRALERLPRERSDRVLLFGGGFHRDALEAMGLAELRRLGGAR